MMIVAPPANVLDKMPKKLHSKAKDMLPDVADDVPYINGIRHDLTEQHQHQTTVAA